MRRISVHLWRHRAQAAGTVGLGNGLAFMSRYAILIPVSRRTTDRRTICWFECELHDGDQVLRNPLRPFFSADAARKWAENQGYALHS